MHKASIRDIKRNLKKESFPGNIPMLEMVRQSSHPAFGKTQYWTNPTQSDQSSCFSWRLVPADLQTTFQPGVLLTAQISNGLDTETLKTKRKNSTCKHTVYVNIFKQITKKILLLYSNFDILYLKITQSSSRISVEIINYFSAEISLNQRDWNDARI